MVVGDFGLSVDVSNPSFVLTGGHGGTKEFLAPEMRKNGTLIKNPYAVDIWGRFESLVTFIPVSGGLVTLFDGISGHQSHCSSLHVLTLLKSLSSFKVYMLGS